MEIIRNLENEADDGYVDLKYPTGCLLQFFADILWDHGDTTFNRNLVIYWLFTRSAWPNGNTVRFYYDLEIWFLVGERKYSHSDDNFWTLPLSNAARNKLEKYNNFQTHYTFL